jgi:hypothetical protein
LIIELNFFRNCEIKGINFAFCNKLRALDILGCNFDLSNLKYLSSIITLF